MAEKQKSLNHHVILDGNLVAKAASRDYFKWMMLLKKHNLSLEDFASALNNDPRIETLRALSGRNIAPSKDLPEEIVAVYKKFRRKAQKNLKVKNLKINIVPMEMILNIPRGYGSKTLKGYDILRGEEYERIKLLKPVWTVDLEISPQLKKLKADVIVITP